MIETIGILVVIFIIFLILVDNAHRNGADPFARSPTPYVAKNDTRLALFMQQKKAYMKSPQWKTKREQAKTRDYYACVICGEIHNLHVHHTNGYMLIPNEPLYMLTTLCGDCHKTEHAKYEDLETYEAYENWDHPINP